MHPDVEGRGHRLGHVATGTYGSRVLRLARTIQEQMHRQGSLLELNLKGPQHAFQVGWTPEGEHSDGGAAHVGLKRMSR
jgi:hypothetical protein